MRRHIQTALAGLLLAGCATKPIGLAPARIDHVILGVADLDQGIDQLERLTGVRAVAGGAHPGRGTRNALMSLGAGTYLELYAPNPAEPITSKDVDELKLLHAPKPLGWAISTDNSAHLRALLARNGFLLTAPDPGSRKRPDGSVLHWQTFDFAGLADPAAPFFILWAEPRLHPSRTSPGGCRLKRLDVRTPVGRLSRAIEPLVLPVTVSAAAEPSLTVTLICPAGEINVR